MATGHQSIIERNFILQALKEEIRVDGRLSYDFRKIKITYGRAHGECNVELQLGQTRVLAVVTSEVVPPFPDRPADGFLHFNTELSPMANPDFESGRPSEFSVEIGRIVERSIKDSRALDTEALCIVAGEKVWSIRVDIHVLDDCGNLIDGAVLATVAALLHFRKPDVSVEADGRVVVHHADRRAPVPLSLHHTPVAVTFSLFDQGALVAIDATDREELVADGRITFVINAHKEVCGVHKLSAPGITVEQLVALASLAATKAGDLVSFLNESCARAEVADMELQRSRGRSPGITAGAAPPAPPASAGEGEVPFNPLWHGVPRQKQAAAPQHPPDAAETASVESEEEGGGLSWDPHHPRVSPTAPPGVDLKAYNVMGLHLPKGPDPTAESSALDIDESSEENEGAVVSDSIPAAGDKRSAWDVDSPPTPVFPVKKSERVQASLAVTKSVTVDLSAALKAGAQVTDGHKGKKKKRKRKKAI